MPQKKGALKTTNLQKPSVFGDDSDDEVGESSVCISVIYLNKKTQ